ncbi:dihydrodipicolinate synthase family protein [Aeoliella sp. SH292]|uniref:dihydrodipicolinate synthase family protein n=1 Tax=Aeoliella sp. SH292 TaxID=3454464 RepID=UPI003F94F8C0
MTRLDKAHLPNLPLRLDPAGQIQASQFIRGIVPPLVTPLTTDAKIDVAGLERLVEHVITGGVHGVFLLGTTGEAAAISLEERHSLITHAARCIRGRVTLLVGVTSDCQNDAISMAQYAAKEGADGVVVASPCYLPLEQAELMAYVHSIVSRSPVPVVLYNMPRLMRSSYESETLQRLIQHDRIVGIKDSSGDLEYLEQVCEVAKQRPEWSVLVGSEDLMIESLEIGAHGCVGGGGNVWPRLLTDLFNAAQSHDWSNAKRLQEQLTSLHQILVHGKYAAGGVRGLKCALDIMGICSGRMAEPYRGCDAPQRDAIHEVLKASGLLNRHRPTVTGRSERVPS